MLFKSLPSPIFIVFPLGFAVLSYWICIAGGGPVSISADSIRISDFIHYLISAKAFWFKHMPSIYTAEAQAQIYSQEFQINIPPMMPLGITPIAFFFLYPFCFFEKEYYSVALSIWNGLSLFVFLTGVNSVLETFDDNSQSTKRFWIISVVVWACSHTLLAITILGQTTLIACGLLLRLITEIRSSRDASLTKLLGILFLSIKPTYFIIALAILLAKKRLKLLFFAMSILFIGLATLTLRLGLNWPIEYLKVISTFSNPNIQNTYSQIFAPQTTTLFSTAFSEYLGKETSFAIARLITSVSIIISLFYFAVCSIIPAKGLNQRMSLIAMSLIGVVLLFSPYLGGYEDLLLLVLIACSIDISKTVYDKYPLFNYLLFFSMYLIANRNLLFTDPPLVFLWILKLLCIVSILSLSLRSYKTRPSLMMDFSPQLSEHLKM